MNYSWLCIGTSYLTIGNNVATSTVSTSKVISRRKDVLETGTERDHSRIKNWHLLLPFSLAVHRTSKLCILLIIIVLEIKAGGHDSRQSHIFQLNLYPC
jgi:hypothetical protein